MKCARARKLFGAYWDDEITQGEREWLESHMNGCAACRNEYETLARTLGVEDAVIFTGPVDHAAIPAFLALADVEGHWLNQDDPAKTSLGIASLEAMSAGKPILAAANPDTYGPGVLRDGENMFLRRSPLRTILLAARAGDPPPADVVIEVGELRSSGETARRERPRARRHGRPRLSRRERYPP